MFSPLSGILRRFSRTFRQITEDIAEKILSALHKGSDIKAIVEHIWQTKGAAESIREAAKATIRESYEKGAHKTLKVFPAHLDAAWDESGMKLSEKLHGADAEMRAAIVKTIREQLRQNQHALKAARALYDGYGNGQAVIRRQHIPKYLQEVIDFARRSDLTEADRAELLKKVRRARRQVERLGQGGAPNQALKTAYRELLDAVTDGTEEALTRSVHTAIEEKSRYVAERIARTEAARAWADGFAEKYMNDDTVVAFRWKLSSRHPAFDICNLYAEADLYGLGKGIFPKDQTPRLPVHPHCLCHLAPVYRSELNKIAHNLVKSGGEKYINVLSLERRQKLLGVAGSKRYAAGQDWRTLARNYTKEKLARRAERATEQYYKKVTLGRDVEPVLRRASLINFRQVTTQPNVHVAEGVTIKPKQLHELQRRLRDSASVIGVGDASTLPPIYIANEVQMGTNALALYNWRQDKIFITLSLLDEDKLADLQRDGVLPENRLSTMVHELIHWKDADEYRKRHPDMAGYVDWINIRCWKKLVALEKRGYNIEVSQYASDTYQNKQYDEVYTEVRTKQLLERRDSS